MLYVFLSSSISYTQERSAGLVSLSFYRFLSILSIRDFIRVSYIVYDYFSISLSGENKNKMFVERRVIVRPSYGDRARDAERRLYTNSRSFSRRERALASGESALAGLAGDCASATNNSFLVALRLRFMNERRTGTPASPPFLRPPRAFSLHLSVTD